MVAAAEWAGMLGRAQAGLQLLASARSWPPPVACASWHSVP